MGEEITYLPDQEVVAYLARYVKIFEGPPESDQRPTPEQLAALSHTFKVCRAPYADFAVFGPHGNRLMRKLGNVFNSAGHLQEDELFGPPNLSGWKRIYAFLMSSLVILDAVSRRRLDDYRKHITQLHDLYGPDMWHVLYQAEVRCRAEHMEILR